MSKAGSNTNGSSKQAEGGKKKFARGVPYDKGMAWVVAFGGFMTLTIVSGIFKGGAIFFAQIQRNYGASNTSLSMIFGLCNLTALLTALPARMLIEKFGTRNSIMLGSFLISLGYSLSSVAPNFYMFYFTLGVCCGLGLSLTFSPVLVLTCTYFRKYRSIANALVVSGTALGGLIMPPIGDAFIDAFELPGSFLLTGGLGLHAIVFATLLLPLNFWTPKSKSKSIKSTPKPLDKAGKQLDIESCQNTDDANGNAKNAVSSTQLHRSLLNISDWNVASINPQHEELAKYDAEANNLHQNHTISSWRSENGMQNGDKTNTDKNLCLQDRKNGVKTNSPPSNNGRSFSSCKDLAINSAAENEHEEEAETVGMLNTTLVQNGHAKSQEKAASPPKLSMVKVAWELLHNPHYVTLSFCHAFFVESYKTIIICVTVYLISLGYTRSDSVNFLMCLYICDLLGRILCIGISLLIQRQRVQRFDKRHAHIIYVHLNGFSLVILAFAGSNRYVLMFVLGLVGLTSGLGVANHAVVLAENCKLKIEHLGIAHSFGMLMQAVATIAISYALGAMADAFGTWKWSLLFAGLLGSFGAHVFSYDIYYGWLKCLFCRKH